MQTLIRNDQYTLQSGVRSPIEIPIGFDLKEKYILGYHERLRLEARGDPRWKGNQGRLELGYDRDAESFEARQPVRDAVLRRDNSLSTTPSDDGEVAALDIGANNLVAVTTTSGRQRLYHGRPSFQRFRKTTEEIAELQSQLAYEQWSSKRIRQLYRLRGDRCDHLQDAFVRNLAEWLYEAGVSEVIVGDLGYVLSTHWSAMVNKKTHLFWSHGRFRRRLQEVLAEVFGIEVREEFEEGSSSCCPACGGERVERSGDLLTCLEYGFEGQSDLAASKDLLRMHGNSGPTARPAVSIQNWRERTHNDVARLKWG